MHAVIPALAVLLACFTMPTPAMAQSDRSQGADVKDIVFSEVERRVIEDFFGKKAAKTDEDDDDDDEGRRGKGGKGKGAKGKDAKGKSGGLPPGLAKRASLPPGLAKQLERNGTLPPGLAKRDLPTDLEALLPKTAKGQERVVVDDDVVLIEKATGVVLDVLRDVVRGQGRTQ